MGNLKKQIVVSGSVFTIYSADLPERCCRCPEGDIHLKNKVALTVSYNGYPKIEIFVFASFK